MNSIMVVGTTSHAGKSFLTTAICRILVRQGWRVTPFKGQNMSLNAYITPDGGEIGYAQAVQAWAAKIIPTIEINPILLKPQGDMISQVIMKGSMIGTTHAAEYYEKYFDKGWNAITSCLEHLKTRYDVIVCEGAGSPAEINLKHRDLTNMRVARYLNAATILVVDIDRGGAFAHVVGTLQLLEPEERALIKGIIINKFRGQRSLLDSGIDWLENYTKIPVLGIIPWRNFVFPSEDSLNLLDRQSSNTKGELTINVLRLSHIANFTDFEPLDAEPTVNLKYLDLQDPLNYPDAVIIPGSKTTIVDLIELHKSGMAKKIRDYIKLGGVVIGICGGFQMLGKQIFDSEQLESDKNFCLGLNLLPMETVITPKKISRQRQIISNYPKSGLIVIGYEIHQGITCSIESKKTRKAITLYSLFDDSSLGVVNDTYSVWGCYLHGLFNNGVWRRTWLNFLRQRRGLSSLPTSISNYCEQRNTNLDILADLVEEFVNLKPILN
ncbi:cobyric acid synthase [cyanobacterium endosymbiont of Rhopalodia gibberula]|uniref:cobyric acid synthase CobQ n=1 Tax=cyanobacterium endosymbiont of Rhopalodia gibberula TaxID=1763363 RepID=UPI000DC6DF92|nr:cobyric acid synthase CobQ [cyanobacterium endosymbiont of Rhopalodia gibberula]BBA78661.1 cobyric acid synthase [cyanobacterium endosymbiont of Rhopalodia gibberula]